jgi:hypothetical protein
LDSPYLTVLVPGHKNKTTDCLFPCLQGAADALPGVAIKSQIYPTILGHTSPRPLHLCSAQKMNNLFGDDKVPIPRFSQHTALVLCYGDAEVPLPHPGVSRLSSSPSPPIVLPQSALQAGGRG